MRTRSRDAIMIPITNSFPILLLTVPFQKLVKVMLTAYILKTIIRRKRPYENNPSIIPFETLRDSSFPSAHTALAFCDASIRHNYLYAILMGISRIYGGMHYFSDVLVGALIGWQICKTSNPTGVSSLAK